MLVQQSWHVVSNIYIKIVCIDWADVSLGGGYLTFFENICGILIRRLNAAKML